MGLFGEDENTAQKQLEAQVADLQRQLAERDDRETPKVAAGGRDMVSMELRQVSIKLPPFSESNPALTLLPNAAKV